jgi:hypothetical protein
VAKFSLASVGADLVASFFHGERITVEVEKRGAIPLTV